MSKNIVFSFDDGRIDTYLNAFRIMQKYNFRGTVNVVTDFLNNPLNYNCFNTCLNKPLTYQNLAEMQNYGWEVACHGHTHQNTVEDVLRNIGELKSVDIETNGIGFASPNSYLTLDISYDFKQLIDKKILKYVRSGIQTRREGYLYSFATLANNYLKNEILFYWLNKKCIISNKNWFILSVGITKYNTVKQMKYLIEKMKDGESLILMFHSILDKSDKGYDIDKWFWDVELFEELCRYLKNNKKINVCTTRELVDYL